MSEYKTIGEWEKIFNVRIVDPDGFDRSDPKLRERKFTREEFEKGMMHSSILQKARVNDNKYISGK